MSTVSLDKLIARKTFFVPAKSSVLHKLVSTQLDLDDRPWQSDAAHPRSGKLSLNLQLLWAAAHLVEKGLPETGADSEKALAKFQKDVFKHSREILKRIIENIPYRVHFVVTEEKTDGCLCEATCYPALYQQLVMDVEVECNEADVQDARLRCEEFLVDIFVGGLGAKEIVEKVAPSRWELLINDVDCRHVTDRVHEMLTRATGEILVMGWVGTDCLPKLKELVGKGVTVQAVTHKPSEMKSPVPKDIQQGYTNLVKILGTSNVSIDRELHGRAVIVDNKALIGSMDLNSFSLSGEHREFAVYTEDADTVRKMRAYFKKIFVPLKE